ncbi:hypothetical protein AAMO2058_000408100 [Amorphochlora amoebiformis]
MADGSDRDLLKPAFAVHGEPNFDRGPPADAMEYLRRVRYEAQRLPQIVVSKIEPSRIKTRTIHVPLPPPLATSPEKYIPKSHWEKTAGSDFADLRQALIRCRTRYNQGISGPWDKEDKIKEPIPSGGDKTAWADYCITTDHKNRRPYVQTLMKMDHVATCAGLLGITSRLEAEGSAVEISDRIGEWLFSLLALLDKPINAKMASCLRTLYRVCALARSKSMDDPHVARCNVILNIISRIFGQRVSS